MKLGTQLLLAPLLTAVVVLSAGQLNTWQLGRDARDQLRPRRQFGTKHLARQGYRGVCGGLGELCLERLERVVDALQQRARLRCDLRRVLAFELRQRCQPISVAVAVAGLTRAGQPRLERSGRRRRVGVGGTAGRRGVVVQRLRRPGGEAVQLLARDESRVGAGRSRCRLRCGLRCWLRHRWRRRAVAPRRARRTARHHRLRGRSGPRRPAGARP